MMHSPYLDKPLRPAPTFDTSCRDGKVYIDTLTRQSCIKLERTGWTLRGSPVIRVQWLGLLPQPAYAREADLVLSIKRR